MFVKEGVSFDPYEHYIYYICTFYMHVTFVQIFIFMAIC